MIQYKHYHDESSGYVDKLSKSGNSRDTEIFSTLRFFKRSKDTCFTYLPKDGKAYLLQVSEKTNEFYHGLADTIESFGDTRVAEYINQLETEHRTDVGADGYLPEGKLPRRSSEFGLSIAKGLNPIFPEAIHALLYTDKPVILVGKDIPALIRYVKVILSLFPAQYANHIGFSVCPDGLPSFFINPNNEIAPLIRLVATDKEISENDSRVVINVTAPPKVENLGPYATAVARMNDMLERGSGDRLNALVRSCCASFLSDGSVDREQLETALTLYNFDMERTAENAEKLIRAWQNDKKETINTFSVIDAVLVLINEKKLTEEQNDLIAKAREKSEINESVANRCGQYAYSRFVNGEALSKMQMDDVMAFLASLPDEALDARSPEMSEIFAKERNVSVLDVLAKAYSNTKKIRFLSLISEYVHILDTFNYQVNFDRDIFNVASKYSECESSILCAIMSTCYIPKVLSSEASVKKTQQRIKAFSTFIESKRLGAVKTVEYILEMKNGLLAVSEKMGLDIHRPDDFAFLAKADVEKYVAALSFADKLRLAISDRVDIGTYVDLKSVLVASLASYDDVRRNVTIGSNLGEYHTFISRYESDLRIYRYDQIKQYINELNGSIDLRKSISDYRCKFVVGSYSGMTHMERAKIARDATATLKNGKTYIVSSKDGVVRDDIRAVLERSTDKEDDSDFAEKQKIAEKISGVIKKGRTKRKGRKDTRNLRYLLYSYLMGILYVVISAAVILSVPVLSATFLGMDIMTRVKEFFNLFHVLALIYVWAFNIICYLVCWSMSNHDRLGSIKKANIRTLVCCVVPIVLYAITYLITYGLS